IGHGALVRNRTGPSRVRNGCSTIEPRGHWHYCDRSWRMEAVRACDDAKRESGEPDGTPASASACRVALRKAKRPPRRSATRSTGEQHRTGLAGISRFVAAALFEQTPSAKTVAVVLAPAEGVEPSQSRLTAGCPTIRPRWNESDSHAASRTQYIAPKLRHGNR